MKKLIISLASIALLIPAITFAKGDTYRFVVVPKVVHPWFDLVNQGAHQAAKNLETTTGKTIKVEYRAPQNADVVEQNQILESTIATRPDGIAVDLLDAKGNRAVLEDAISMGIKVVVFDSLPPEGMHLTAIGNDFCEQGTIAAERLVDILDEKGEVAIMLGVPTAPNHKLRGECEEKVFAKYPNIKVVAKGIDNDSIETAQEQAAAIMQAHPNLAGWVSVDAAGPIGIGQAVKEANKVGKVLSVGTDDLPQLIELIREGVVDSSSSTKPRMQGYWSVVSLWQETQGINMPKTIDTGIAFITPDMVKGEYQGF